MCFLKESDGFECSRRGLRFIPLKVLDSKITVDLVRANLSTWTRMFREDPSGQIVRDAKKIFAILLLIHDPGSIEQLFQDGLRDAHLPLERRNPEDKYLVCKKTDREFHSFRYWDFTKSDGFLNKQWIVQAPKFKSMGEHIDLDPMCALPLVGKAELIGRGQASKVYKGSIHRDHQSFASPGTEVAIAIKEFDCEDETKMFDDERSNLENAHAIVNKHLIKHIASCLSKKDGYVFFPWAEGGDLWNFWACNDTPKRKAGLLRWAFGEMLGLSSALDALHDVNCRHGDLKPDNILHFKTEKDLGVLVIADLGVSRFHIKGTQLRQVQTTTKATTPTYQGPEVVDKVVKLRPRARTYDVWSMGCILLEFTIWLLWDCDALSKLQEQREHPDLCFYTTSERKELIVHPGVDEAIRELTKDPRCRKGTVLADLINLIQNHLIKVNVSDRYSAKELHQKLREISSKVDTASVEIFHATDSDLKRPEIFGEVTN